MILNYINIKVLDLFNQSKYNYTNGIGGFELIIKVRSIHPISLNNYFIQNHIIYIYI